MIRGLQRFFRGRRASFDPPVPDRPIRAIGDVHGRLDLLESALAASRPGELTLMLGDYVDRGEQSAGVLRRLHREENLVCLMGNHEAMMLKFLSNPEKQGRLWLRNGGLQTLVSFGVGQGRAVDQAAALREAMGDELLAWLEGLPRVHRSGNIAFIHAGADPNVPIEAQDPHDLIWGHPAFRKRPRTDGLWVVHGHNVVPEPEVRDGRVAVDTGAWATGRLTAARFARGEVDFETFTT